jgi:hypothetical protein
MMDVDFDRWLKNNNEKFYEINWIKNQKYLHFEPYFISTKSTPLYIIFFIKQIF